MSRVDGPDFTGAPLREALAKTWSDAPGFWGWLTAVDHKRVGRRYIVTAFVFLGLGGVLALLMRTQLARPESGLISADRYNQIFSMHGSTMMFLFAVPVMEAMAVFIIPLMMGTRQIAFPRLNAFSYWIYLFGGMFLWIAFLLNIGPEAGWFSYVPLAGPEYSPGKRTDVWAQLITFTEVAALASAVELITTILKQRAPGMSLNRMPLFAWSILVTSFMVVFAMPAVMLASSFLISDRLVATQFYNPAEGGDALLWQHLFWFFGHPEVYIIFIPAVGFVSQITETFSEREVFGYPLMVLAVVSIGLLAFGLWVHHMFATGLPRIGYSFYTAASMMIALPGGVQIFCWIATIWSGRPRWETPLWWVVAFIITFVMGGLTGVMVASVPLDLQMHDTYFVVAHFHYVLIGGAVFPLLGAVTYWFPKFSGRLMAEPLGKWNVLFSFLAFHLTFFPMHITGLLGMPRRVYTYPHGLGWDTLNLVSSIGAFLFAGSVLLFLGNVFWSLRNGRVASANPWNAPSLEWKPSSPPPVYNFEHIPVVHSRSPLWETDQPVMPGLQTDKRELLVTTAIDAVPDLRDASPPPNGWPFFAAIATTMAFVGSIFTPWAVIWGALLMAIPLIFWFWPHDPLEPKPEQGDE
ncbi:MAG: cytochrome c oxidase subunit I [Proteobacteria bacterium]|nr:cytochrome c oxidase subunit I [Pseudomonadota bacterium]